MTLLQKALVVFGRQSEVAAALGVSRQYVNSLVRSGQDIPKGRREELRALVNRRLSAIQKAARSGRKPDRGS